MCITVSLYHWFHFLISFYDFLLNRQLYNSSNKNLMNLVEGIDRVAPVYDKSVIMGSSLRLLRLFVLSTQLSRTQCHCQVLHLVTEGEVTWLVITWGHMLIVRTMKLWIETAYINCRRYTTIKTSYKLPTIAQYRHVLFLILRDAVTYESQSTATSLMVPVRLTLTVCIASSYIGSVG